MEIKQLKKGQVSIYETTAEELTVFICKVLDEDRKHKDLWISTSIILRDYMTRQNTSI